MSFMEDIHEQVDRIHRPWIMGAPMAARLLNAGYPLSVFNRTKEKAEGLISRGAVWCQSPKEAAEHSDIIFSMLANSKALEETAAGNGGVIQGLRKGVRHVDMSTVSPMTTKKLGAEYKEQGSSSCILRCWEACLRQPMDRYCFLQAEATRRFSKSEMF